MTIKMIKGRQSTATSLDVVAIDNAHAHAAAAATQLAAIVSRRPPKRVVVDVWRWRLFVLVAVRAPPKISPISTTTGPLADASSPSEDVRRLVERSAVDSHLHSFCNFIVFD